MKKYVIGVDLGGTKITTAISDLTGTIIEKTTLATGSHLGEQVVMERIFDSISMVLEASKISTEDVRAIGVGAPGPLDAIKGTIITTPNLPFKNYNVVKPIEDHFGIRTYLDNDANAAAIGEYTFGAGKGTKHMIYITVSTGVGGGAVLNGRPYRGNTSNALEVGHMTIEPFSRHQCNCGKYGDLEALASGTAIAKRAKEAVEEGRETSLKDIETITSYEVHQAYLEGDQVAVEILESAFMYMGIGVANLIVNFDPEVIVIGGGVTKIGDLFFEKVKDAARRRSFDFMFDATKILPAELGQEAGVVGALALALIESEDK
ncbi:MAG TPA: ROK family protein [Bacteroidales bacterium]|nr:ROK family protein [Bacteroidales bacterium]